jgi:hypothetical protein
MNDRIKGPTLLGAELGELAEYPCTEEQNQRFLRQKQADERKRAEEDLADMRSMANKALTGVYGQASKAVALAWCEDICGHPNDVAARANRIDLEQLRSALRKVPDRVSG